MKNRFFFIAKLTGKNIKIAVYHRISIAVKKEVVAPIANKVSRYGSKFANSIVAYLGGKVTGETLWSTPNVQQPAQNVSPQYTTSNTQLSIQGSPSQSVPKSQQSVQGGASYSTSNAQLSIQSSRSQPVPQFKQSVQDSFSIGSQSDK